MNAISQIKIRLDPYLWALPDIFNYQIATKILLALWLFLLGRVFQVLLRSTGRVAVTTGDWQFLFTTWQGIFILLLALIVGVGVSISLTKGLYIPTFISSVIEGSFLYSAARAKRSWSGPQTRGALRSTSCAPVWTASSPTTSARLSNL